MNLTLLFIPIALILLWKRRSEIRGEYTGYDRVLTWRDVCQHYIYQYAPDIPLHLVLGIIATESMGQHELIKGSSGEIGVMQITPAGLSYAGTGYTTGQIDRDAGKNIETGVAHLAKDLQRFSDINLAIMAYNIDRRHIDRLISGTYTSEDERFVNIVGKGYLSRVKKHAKELFRIMGSKDIDNPESEQYIKPEFI